MAHLIALVEKQGTAADAAMIKTTMARVKTAKEPSDIRAGST
jgi:hypothetical protein